MIRTIGMILVSMAIYGFFAALPGIEAAVELKQVEGGVEVAIDDEPFTTYNFDDGEFPYFYPLRAPGGINVTRHWPMRDGDKDEQRDHRHHRSLWFAHGNVNGLDFWTAGKAPDIVQTRIVSIESGENEGRLVTENEWRDGDGKMVCSDRRTYIFTGDGDSRSIDFGIVLKAVGGPVVFADTKEGSMAVRVAPGMRLKGPVARGSILMSNGVAGRNAWGKRAKWCDYSGPVDGRMLGIAIFDAPTNPRHPSWWHARDYGLCAANPFGISYFEDKPRGSGDYELPKGHELKFDYRILIHDGRLSQAQLEQHYEQWRRSRE